MEGNKISKGNVKKMNQWKLNDLSHGMVAVHSIQKII